MNVSTSIKNDYDITLLESTFEEGNGEKAAAIIVAWEDSLSTVTMWFGSAEKRAQFVDALLALTMDYEITRKGEETCQR